MTRSDILDMMNALMKRRGRDAIVDETQTTRAVTFRSLDFSEIALRIEGEIDRELSFDAASMRRIETVADVLDFFVEAIRPA